MLAHRFTTEPLPKHRQLEAWRAWYDTVFDVAQEAANDDFVASNSTWTIGGLTLSRVVSPPNTVTRTRTWIRHNAADHWSLTLSKKSVTDVASRDVSFEAEPKTPFIISFGQEIRIRRRQTDDRLQLIMARDSFQAIAPLLDAATGTALSSQGAKMLADYILLLEKNVPALEADAVNRLPGAVEAMLAVCLGPIGQESSAAGDQIRLTLMERVRQAVWRNLRLPSLGPDKLCREVDVSRSQLYRLLEGEGGVAHYIQRRRLEEGFAMLRDAGNHLPIGRVAELLCFADASTFSRSFRREFGLTPGDVRAAGNAGHPPASTTRSLLGPDARTFSDCLRHR